jgi:hypothetical protein
MRHLALAVLLIAAAGLTGPPAQAADAKAKVVVAPAPVVVEPVVVEPVEPLPGASILVTKPPPRVAYGCKRIWRCDKEVCEWRRGCWGVYGYIESPYYSQELAKRQWVRDGLPGPPEKRARY